eukprot:8161799-Prorocentrum_lima.AAC.1
MVRRGRKRRAGKAGPQQAGRCFLRTCCGRVDGEAPGGETSSSGEREMPHERTTAMERHALHSEYPHRDAGEAVYMSKPDLWRHLYRRGET